MPTVQLPTMLQMTMGRLRQFQNGAVLTASVTDPDSATCREAHW